ncbi:hypothetical protein A6769_02510 [Nostoc punctiforme NIES-2108]|uniref:Uncharacterized protein n=1 Tax=Nostoc punctiforme NIES-2108 TaxID=1356359 RepID=A0A367S1G6_NOSPU|nr:hypothetical protein A6769_02510 [Nostoc punctiforme NIES-2108]
MNFGITNKAVGFEPTAFYFDYYLYKLKITNYFLRSLNILTHRSSRNMQTLSFFISQRQFQNTLNSIASQPTGNTNYNII